MINIITIAATIGIVAKKIPEAYSEKEDFGDVLKVLLIAGGVVSMLFLANLLI